MSTEFISAVPIIPVRDIEQSAAWYGDRLGFTIFHTEDEYGIVGRGETWIHFWGPSGIPPEESDTMIRVGVRGIDQLYALPGRGDRPSECAAGGEAVGLP